MTVGENRAAEKCVGCRAGLQQLIYRDQPPRIGERIGESERLAAQIRERSRGTIGRHDQVRVVNRFAFDLRDDERLHPKRLLAFEIGVGADDGERHGSLAHEIVDLIVGLALHELSRAIQLFSEIHGEVLVEGETLARGIDRRDGDPQNVITHRGRARGWGIRFHVGQPNTWNIRIRGRARDQKQEPQGMKQRKQSPNHAPIIAWS